MSVRRILIAVVMVLASAPWTAMATDWKTLKSNHISKCEGPVQTASTGKVVLGGIGDAQGVKHDPKCGDTVPVYSGIVKVDQDGNWSFSGDSMHVEAVRCAVLRVSLPSDARICQVRYYASNSQGKDLRERKELRNSGKAKEHEWAKKEKTKFRSSNKSKEIKALYKNWRQSYKRVFAIEVDYQRPPMPE